MDNAALTRLLVDVRAEVDRADAKYGALASTHEAYGVLAEEATELLDAIRENEIAGVLREARQVAAVALRLAVYCEEGAAEFITRSTGA